MSGIIIRMPLKINCPICCKPMDWHEGVGWNNKVCSRDCNEEFQHRYSLSIRNLPYVERKKGATTNG